MKNSIALTNGSWGWSAGAIVLDKIPVPGRPANLDHSRARASALAVGPDGGCLDIFLSSVIFLFSPSQGDDPM